MPLPQDLIRRKRDGLTLEPGEIEAFVAGVTDGSLTDYQAAAFLMAVFLRGMTESETAALTRAMADSGRRLAWPSGFGPLLDKHSTGGVGDKVSLLLAPAAASLGLRVPMLSGRGLGHTGGTLDKLEAIPGFRTRLGMAEIQAQVASLGCVMAGQTDDLAPADRRLYALRDVTATVESIPLICASILSKKLAEGLQGLVLDVKFGSGAFLPDPAQARLLAETLVATSRAAGLPCRALLTDMDEPLGRTAGNALEVAECLAFLDGADFPDLFQVTAALLGEMLDLAGRTDDAGRAPDLLRELVRSGALRDHFRRLVAAQGGDPAVVDRPNLLPRAPCQTVIAHDGPPGFLVRADALLLGRAALALGAGRVRAEDGVDPSAGLSDLRKVGEPVAPGQPLAILHHRQPPGLAEALTLARSAFQVGPVAPVPRPLVAGRIV